MKIRELEELILNKKKEAKEKLNADDLNGAKELKNEIENLSEKLILQKELEEDKKNEILNNKEKNNFVQLGKQKNNELTLANYIKNSYRGNITDSLKENVDTDGGYIVPKDIFDDINQLLRNKDSLKELVSTEKVKKSVGARTFELHAWAVPCDKVEEESVFKELSNQTFKRINYKLSKYRGFIKTSEDILKESPTSIVNYVKNCIVEK